MNYEIKQYPDKTTYVEVNKIDYNSTVITPNVYNAVNSITFRINDYSDLWQLNQLVDAYNNLGIKPNILIPNLLEAQADKRFAKNQSSGLKLVGKFLNSMDANFTVFHPHNQEVLEALVDDVKVIDNSEFVESVLGKLSPINNLVILSPDAGAYKWVIKTADKVGFRNEVFTASKSRSYKDRKTTLTQVIGEQDFKGKDVLILDDICIFGGTFKGLSKILKERNCGKLYLAVSHLTVQNLGDDPATNYFDKVFTTNSKYDEYYSKDIPPKNLKVIKLF